MQHPPSTIKKAFRLVSDVEKQLQMANSFKLEFSSYLTSQLNELCAEESSGDEEEFNEMSEVRDGETIIIAIRNILVLTTIRTTATDPTKTDLRTTNKANSGDKNQRTPRSL